MQVWPSLRALALLLVTCAGPLSGQFPVTAPPAALPSSPDTTAADSARTDSLRRLADTLSTTDRLLRGQRDQQIHLDPLPRCGVAPLHPGGTITEFNRDSIDWVTAENISELLATIPGVFLERGDWLGAPELPNYMGRGASSVEYELDCVPLLPMGADSVAFDPSTVPLGFLDQINVETSPGMMRVYLFTRAHDRQAPRTKIAVAQGDRGISRYFGSFERRYKSGLGLSLGADYYSLNATGNGSGGYSMPSGWAQVSYAPNPHYGVQAQLLSSGSDRNLLLNDAGTDTLFRQVDASRIDMQLRGSWRQRTDGLGAGLDVFAANTRVTSDSAPGNTSVSEYGAVASLRGTTWSAQWSAWHYTVWTPLDTRIDVGWSPLALVSASVQVAGQAHQNDRFSRWATGRLGTQLPFGFHIEGTFSGGRRVQAPTIATDTGQQFSDAELTAGFHSKPLTLDASYVADHAWRPEAFSEYVAISGLAPLPQTDWVTVHARYAPVNFFTLETVYQHPQHGELPDGTPPEHAISTATLRSNFRRNFQSGIFQLKLQAIVESWSPGIGGRDSTGAAIPLPGATFFRAVIQFQLGPFIAYYDRINLQATKTGYVPGYAIQPLGSSFGVRWEFSN